MADAPGVSSTSSASGRARIIRTSAIALSGALLLMTFLTGILAGRARQRASLDARLTSAVTERSNVVSDYFERARSLILLLAHDPSFAGLYGTADGREAAIARDAAEIIQAREAIKYLQHLYDGRINEICFIDRSGAENARVVHQHQATAAELSSDESGNAFFTPTFALAAGEVLQAAPYRSPDTSEWVVSSSTPVVAGAVGAPAIVHFEISLEAFRQLIIDNTQQVDIQIVDAMTGKVIVDSRYSVLKSPELDTPDNAAYPQLMGNTATDGLLTRDGTRAAFHKVRVDQHNANDWYIVTSAPTVANGLWAGVGFGTISLLASAVLLLVLGSMSLRTHQRHLRMAATSDSLTGLPNRNLLLEVASEKLEQATRSGSGVALMLLDLDRFKEINDTLGHQWGDELLQAIGPRIQPAIRAGDMVARLGGDEFVILLADVAAAEVAQRIAERIVGLLEQPFQLGELACGIEASIGIAIGPRDGADVHTLMQHADVAMYVAKQNRFGVTVYDPVLDLHNPRKLSMLGELRVAIEQHQLVLHYQPKTPLNGDEHRGVEALVRWQHPERGLIPPDEFIPLAEHTALIQPLTTYVLDEALAQCRRWLDGGNAIAVAVNVSARSLHDASFFDQVCGQLLAHGVPPELLELEITESAIMADPKGARELLLRFHELGVRLAIDDFGTGYSSLAYLKTLPVHALKIDRSFVRGLHHEHSDAVIVQSVIDLGRNLGLAVVAEGVEDAGTVAYLSQAGCTTGQGWFWSKAVPADELAQWITSPDDVAPAGDVVAGDPSVEGAVR